MANPDRWFFASDFPFVKKQAANKLFQALPDVESDLGAYRYRPAFPGSSEKAAIKWVYADEKEALAATVEARNPLQVRAAKLVGARPLLLRGTCSRVTVFRI